MRRVFTGLAMVVLAIAGVRLWAETRRPPDDPRVLGQLNAEPAPPPFRHASEAELYAAAAARAWAYIDANWEERTGFVRTVPEWPVATVWDIGSGLAALVSAHDLGLVERAEYERRLARVLETLAGMPLFDGAAFNKTYTTSSARMLSRADSVSSRGFGWSAIDMGRLLIWLRVVADREPQFADAAQTVVDRLDFGRLVRDGYLHGEDLDRRGRPRTYVEGTLGYEQYAARGFALWGHPAGHALNLTENAKPLDMWGETVLIDRRRRDCLTSEPFVLTGLELGWSPAMRLLALNVLRVQEARWQRTGQVTVASEDASLVPPYHFYYFCVHGEGKPFHVVGPAHLAAPDGPRTVSAKAALAWYAVAPTPYTAQALDHIMDAWPDSTTLIAGVTEETGAAIGPPNVNTAAVILEAAAYLKRARPLLGR